MDNALYSCRHGLEDNVERRLKEFAGAFLGVSPEEAWRQRNEALFVDGVPAYVEGSAYMGSVAMKSLLARFKTALESFDMSVIDGVSVELQRFTKFSGVGEILETYCRMLLSVTTSGLLLGQRNCRHRLPRAC